jgi:membrane protein
VAAVLLVVAGVLGVLARRETARAIPPIPRDALAGARRDIDTIKESAHR